MSDTTTEADQERAGLEAKASELRHRVELAELRLDDLRANHPHSPLVDAETRGLAQLTAELARVEAMIARIDRAAASVERDKATAARLAGPGRRRRWSLSRSADPPAPATAPHPDAAALEAGAERLAHLLERDDALTLERAELEQRRPALVAAPDTTVEDLRAVDDRIADIDRERELIEHRRTVLDAELGEFRDRQRDRRQAAGALAASELVLEADELLSEVVAGMASIAERYLAVAEASAGYGVTYQELTDTATMLARAYGEASRWQTHSVFLARNEIASIGERLAELG